MVLQPQVSAALADLQSRVRGDVMAPDDARYDTARKGFNLVVDQYPALIVEAETVSDIVEAVRFANREDLNIAVQSTGHGTVRPADDKLLIITSRMNRVRIDVATQTAYVEAGVQWGQVLEQAQMVGLAPLLGSSPEIGVVGYSLGGGMGWLARKYGLATDSIRSIELVTADGQFRHASNHENAELFWGLRGGSGAFGVVTAMEIQLFPVTTVYAGNLYYPVEYAQEVITRYRDWIADAPDELTSAVLIMNFPPIPEVPEPLRGQSFAVIRGSYVGSVEQGKTLLQTWRDWQAPAIDAWDVMPFADAATISNDPVDPLPSLMTTMSLSELNDDVIEILIRNGITNNGLIFAEIRHAGGAMKQVDPASNAYSHRHADLILCLVGVTPTSEAHQALTAYTNQFKEELQPYAVKGFYMNFLEGEESRTQVQSNYAPETLRRLQALK